MRLLLVSDTHGDLDAIGRLADEERVDAVVHAGDLGFYDAESPGRLGMKEDKRVIEALRDGAFSRRQTRGGCVAESSVRAECRPCF